MSKLNLNASEPLQSQLEAAYRALDRVRAYADNLPAASDLQGLLTSLGIHSREDDLLPQALWTRHGSGPDEWWSHKGYEARKDGVGNWVLRKSGDEQYRHPSLQVVMAHAERELLEAPEPNGSSASNPDAAPALWQYMLPDGAWCEAGENPEAWRNAGFPVRPLFTHQAPAHSESTSSVDELASMTRMFHAACADLGSINEALELDPDDGGAEPILAAIQKLQGRTSPQGREALRDVIRCLRETGSYTDEEGESTSMLEALLVSPSMSDEAISVVRALLELARAAFHALDNSEEREGADYTEFVLSDPWFHELSNALDALDELPDDKPGYTLGPAGRVEWALRELLAAVPVAADATWQPIETAPTDGTEVALLFAAEVEVLGQMRPRVRAASWRVDWTIPYRRDNPPTHWMPMPAAPGVAPVAADAGMTKAAARTSGYALRVCEESDVQCSRGCGAGPCAALLRGGH